jgi:selenocysteine lyase/cysteine desulfurase
MWNGLAGIAGVNLYGPTPDKPRTPTLAFTVDGSDARTVSMRLAERGVFVSHGDFYAMTVVNRLGLREQGLVRAGCGVYTSEQEVERLLAGVSEIAA